MSEGTIGVGKFEGYWEVLSSVAVATFVWHLLCAGPVLSVLSFNNLSSSKRQVLPNLLGVSLPGTLPRPCDCQARLICVIHTCSGAQRGLRLWNALGV